MTADRDMARSARLLGRPRRRFVQRWAWRPEGGGLLSTSNSLLSPRPWPGSTVFLRDRRRPRDPSRRRSLARRAAAGGPAVAERGAGAGGAVRRAGGSWAGAGGRRPARLDRCERWFRGGPLQGCHWSRSLAGSGPCGGSLTCTPVKPRPTPWTRTSSPTLGALCRTRCDGSALRSTPPSSSRWAPATTPTRPPRRPG